MGLLIKASLWQQELVNIDKYFQFDLLFGKLNAQLKVRLKTNEWIVYENLYLKDKTEQEVAKMLGYKTSEKNRSPGYKQIKNIQKSIIIKAKRILEKDELDWMWAKKISN